MRFVRMMTPSILLLSVCFVAPILGAKPEVGIARQTPHRLLVSPKTQTWSGIATAEESADGLLELSTGPTMRYEVYTFDLGLDEATIDAQMTDPLFEPFTISGEATISYDAARQAYSLKIEDAENCMIYVARFQHKTSDDLDVEATFASAVESLFVYLDSPDPGAPMFPGGVAVNCPPNYSCCEAGVCVAICAGDETAACSSNGNGCTARCRKRAV